MRAQGVFAALAGLVFLALCVVALAVAVPVAQVPTAMWFFVYLMLVACAFFTWHHRQAPQSPAGWLWYLAGALLAGVLFSGVDYLLFGTRARSLPEFSDSNAGIVVELAFFGLAGVVALAGWVRALCLGGRRV